MTPRASLRPWLPRIRYRGGVWTVANVRLRGAPCTISHESLGAVLGALWARLSARAPQGGPHVG